MDEFENVKKGQFEKIYRTESELGISLLDKDLNVLEHFDIPDKNSDVIDVTGCGDVAMAAIVWSKINGYSDKVAINVADHLASFAARRSGTTVIKPEEIEYIKKNILKENNNE